HEGGARTIRATVPLGVPSWRVTYRSRPVGSPWGLGLDTPGTRKNVQGRCGAEKTSSSEVLTSRLAMAGVSFWLLRELRESPCRGSGGEHHWWSLVDSH